MYLVLKLLHVFAVVMFLGNIIVGIFWKVLADLSRDPAIIAHTLRTIIRLDRWITMPSVIVIAVAGVGAALAGHLPMLHTLWLFGGIVLFVVAGVTFGVWVGPLQARLRTLAEAGAAGGTMDWEGYRRLSARWTFWGMVATLAPLTAMALMVLKPE